MDEPIEHRVGDRRVAQIRVPLIARQLTRDDRRACGVAILHHLEEILALHIGHGGEAPVIEDQEFYLPFPHEYASRMTILIRVQGDPGNFFAPVRHTITAVNQDLSVVDLRTMDDLLEDLAGQRRIPATALTVVGLLGLLLSAVGLFGAVAYGVRERAGEFGIRLALGARPADVRRLVLRQGFTIIGIGLAFGATATAALIPIMRSRLFGVDPLDPPTLAAVCAVLSAVGFAALYLPARWASRIEPADTLRAE